MCFHYRRHQLSDPSRPEFSSDDGTKVDTTRANADATKQLDEQKESADAKPSYDCSKFVVDFDKDYECASPNSNIRHDHGHEANGMSEYGCSSSAMAPLMHEASSQRREVSINGVIQIDQNREAGSCDWEHMMSDTSELLVFESPDDRDSYNNSVDHGTNFYTGIKSDMQNLQLICAVDSGDQVLEGNEPENLSTQPGDENEMDNMNAGESLSNSDEKLDYEVKRISHSKLVTCFMLLFRLSFIFV